MGNWNATCMVSRLPILEGEKCVGFLIASRGNARRTSYPAERYIPISPALIGEYDGYGGLNTDIPAKLIETLKSAGLDGRYDIHSDHDFLSDPTLGIPRSQLRNTMIQYERDSIMPVSLVLIKERFFDMAYANFSTTMVSWEYAQTAFVNGRATPDQHQYLLAMYSADNTLPSCVRDLMKQGFDMAGPVIMTQLLTALRHEWTPCSGAGSQQEITDIILDFHKIALEEAEYMNRQNDTDASSPDGDDDAF